jgi:drug/metabolite transporter (DMT)-like permease
MTTTDSLTPTRSTATRHEAGYGPQITMVMLAAFTLSVVHTAYSRLAGVEVPSFTVTTPLTWIFYAVAFSVSVLARWERRSTQLVVTGFLAVVLAIGIFYYPTTFGPEQQTVFGWFENDVYLGLLTVALYLSIQRLRRVTLVPIR